MKTFIEKINSTENRVWGTIALVLLLVPMAWPFALAAMILWWDAFSRDEKVRMTMIIACNVLIIAFSALLGWLFGLGAIASCVWLVFYIVCIVKFYKGDLGYKIPLAFQIADAIVKKTPQAPEAE